jgi:asparagine synthase (glutamine-hydrolysing)
MCGINGFNFKDEILIKNMNSTISHRGPDDRGFELFDNLSLGHVRLSILDLSSKGHQPMNFNHLTITYNGEIYNFKEIRDELTSEGYSFNSDCDTEVILAAYDRWGSDCVKKFNGMWAFVIYDSKLNKLFLSRDRFGEKPLYYYFDSSSEKFIFSSEIKSILNFDFKFSVDKNSINEIFAYRFTYSDNTIFSNIFNFQAGNNMVFDLSSSSIESYDKYYTVSLKKCNLNFDCAKKKLFSLIDESVKARMVSDVPVATFLSGGIDSSIVTYFAKKYNSNLSTFSIGFDTTNELSHAKIVADHLGTNHHEFIINKDNVLDYLEEMIYHMDEPIGADPGFLPIFVLSKETKKFNTVVLTGDGADEIFTGYDRYKLLHYGNYLKHFSFFKSKNQIINRLNSMKEKSLMKSFFEITRVFESDELKKLGFLEKIPNFSKYENLKTNNLNKIQMFDFDNLLLKDFFMKSDKMSSAFGLEQRTPFMDKKIVEFGLSLPIFYRLRGWDEKYILKQVACDILPKSIWKRRKHGFNVPIDYWFENTLGVKLRSLLDNSSHGYYNKDYVLSLLDSLPSLSGGFKARNVVAQKLWTVLVFEMWCERFLK